MISKITRAGALSALLLSSAACATAKTPPPVFTKGEAASQIGEAQSETSAPAGQQWLYGSAEGTVVLRQTWQTIAAHAEKMAANRPVNSVVLAEGATADNPKWLACGDKPLAAVFDADETLLWNMGVMRFMAERKVDFDPKIWFQWEKTGAGKALATPGSVAAFARMRKAGVTMIVNTNRSNYNPRGTEATLAAAGLGNFKHGESLFLRGDTPGGSEKDGRRAKISENYCVVALVGDQLGDVADIFNAKELRPMDRKTLASHSNFDGKWGNGWFVLANPIYGPDIAGSFDEVFPEETRWAPEAPK